MVHRATMSDNEWYIEWQRATTSYNEWPRLILLFFQIRKESTTNNPMENSLNLQENLEERYWIKSRRKPLRKIWMVRSRNDRSSCLQVFLKIGALKIFAIFTGKNLCWSLLIQLQVFRPATLLKADSNAGAFLWILRNWWIPVNIGGCFWNWDIFLVCDTYKFKIYQDSMTQT